MGNTGAKKKKADTYFEQVPVGVVKRLVAGQATKATTSVANTTKSKRPPR